MTIKDVWPLFVVADRGVFVARVQWMSPRGFMTKSNWLVWSSRRHTHMMSHEIWSIRAQVMSKLLVYFLLCTVYWWCTLQDSRFWALLPRASWRPATRRPPDVDGGRVQRGDKRKVGQCTQGLWPQSNHLDRNEETIVLQDGQAIYR